MDREMRGFVTGVLLALLACSSSARPGHGAVSHALLPITGLHIVGNQIKNSIGQVVPFRGVDVSGTEYMCINGTNQIFDPASGAPNATTAPPVAPFQTWGINIIRLPLNESCWLGINGAATGGSTYQTAIESFVSSLTSAGIAVILDLQWVGPGSVIASSSVCGGQFAPAPDNDHAPAFWESVAAAFATNESVIFDLYNEPWLDDTSTGWGLLLNGGTISGGSYSSCPTYTSAGTQALVNDIRTAEGSGYHHIIDVPGVGYTNVLDNWLAYEPSDSASPAQLNAAWHSYQGQICDTLSCWTSVILPIMNSVPLMTEEMGENDCTDLYVDPLMVWEDAHGGNYLAWAWDTYNCNSFPAVISDTTGTPTGFGIDIRNHYLTMSGQPVPTPPPITFFATPPFGLAVGRTGNYTASDGTVYYQDPYIQTASGTFIVAPGLQENMQTFQPFSTSDTITGTPDPTLYQTGRESFGGTWIINIPNGTYYVTLGMSLNSEYNLTGSIAPTSAWGQNQFLQGTEVNGCIWTSYSGSNTILNAAQSSPGSGYTNGIYSNVSLTGGTGTGAFGTIYVSGGQVTYLVVTNNGNNAYQVGDTLFASIPGGSGFQATVYSPADLGCSYNGSSVFVPAVDTAYTITYTVGVYAQQLTVEVAAAFGSGRNTVLNSIKVVPAP
jgi:hypothetical protein